CCQLQFESMKVVLRRGPGRTNRGSNRRNNANDVAVTDAVEQPGEFLRSVLTIDLQRDSSSLLNHLSKGSVLHQRVDGGFSCDLGNDLRRYGDRVPKPIDSTLSSSANYLTRAWGSRPSGDHCVDYGP